MKKLTIAAIGLCACAIAFFQSKPKPAAGFYKEYVLPPAPAWVHQVSERTRRTRPNILFVIYDGRRRDDFGFGPHGNTRNDTPFLSEFKNRAAYFPAAVAPGCWTVPSHASIFSGLSVRDLGIDLYEPGYNVYPGSFLSLPEILRLTGYRTIAYADHPYFLGDDVTASLLRGFEYYSVIRDFRHGFATLTNVPSRQKRTQKLYPLRGLENLSLENIRVQVARFNAGALRFDLSRQADYDPTTGLYFPHLYPLFQESEYFQKRYRNDFDKRIFAEAQQDPFFVFLNLHMCTVAVPDPQLWSKWVLQTLFMNAQVRQIKIATSPEDRTLADVFDRNVAGLPFANLASNGAGRSRITTLVKGVFDNRFYDCCFRAFWEYLDNKGLTDNTVTIVASDHGVGHSERDESFYLHGGARPHETITRVPLVIRFPESSTLARLHGKYEQTVGLTDLFQTMVELGIGPDVLSRDLSIRGKSLVRRIVDGDYETMVFAECTLKPDSYDTLPQTAGYARAVYADNMKLIYAPGTHFVPDDLGFSESLPPDAANGETLIELYDLSCDPDEQSNLARTGHPALAKMLKLFEMIRINSAATDKPVPPEWDAAATDTLRALGYIE